MFLHVLELLKVESNFAKHDTTAFIPFSLGPANCVGQKFAKRELMMVTSLLLKSFNLRIDRCIFCRVVNDEFLGHVRNGACKYVRGDPVRLTSPGVLTNVRDRDTKPASRRYAGPASEFRLRINLCIHQTIDADVVVLATGFEKPTISFLYDSLFPEGYQRPDLYLQNFSTEDWSVLMTNSSYMSAIGTVGHFHIGIYTRILLTLLLDENARPSPKDMKLWVDFVRFMKCGAAGGPLGFFTYAELTIWIAMFHVLRPDSLRW
ncbi:hypothetical protein B0H17DRAFT_1205572 [Mycena rosella]|uniref:Cytochrome P450 n=1 Tax=Mycena rosella TaxID=1033263 RepID=A0AAD7D8A0_MYCRO|nr:hypothetical protein B0H17DRAFT_1205572 [Mycena rosella]